MTCSRCGTMNADGSAFCMNCGNPLSGAQNTNFNMNMNASAAGQNSQDYAPVQNQQGFDAEQNNQNFVPEQANQGFAPEQNYQNFAPEQNNPPFAPEQSNQGFVPEQSYQGFNPEQNNQGYVADPNGANYTDNQYGNYEYSEQAAPKKNKWLMPAIIGGAALIAIIVVIVVLVSSMGGRYVLRENAITLLPSDDDTAYIVVNGEKLETKIDGKDFGSQYSSVDGTVYSFIADETLYVVDGTDVKNIADDVKGCRLAPNGGALIFVDSENTTYYYNLSDEEKIEISSEELSSIAISPDGNTVVYAESTESGVAVYMRNGSDKIEIDDDFESGTRVIGVSDDGDYIYIMVYKKGENTYDSGKYDLRVYTDAGEDYNAVASDVESGSLYSTIFNYDYTQVLFNIDDKTYVSEKGEERVQISSQDVAPMVPGTASSNGINSFFDLVYYSSDSGNIYYVDSDGVDYKLASDTRNRRINEEGDVVYYIKDGTLYSVEAEKNPKPKDLMEDVDSFEMTIDGGDIYFLEDGDLYYHEGRNSAEKIKSDVEKFDLSGEGICFFMCGDRLYMSEGGSKAESVADDVDQFAVTYWYAAYLVEEDSVQKTYMSTGDDDFELVSEKTVENETAVPEYND